MKHFGNENYKPENYRYVGKVNVPRKDAKEIVTGKCTFLDDFTLPRMLIGRALRSPHAHARIVHINVEKARKLEGVAAVLTYKDVDQSWKMGWPPMKPILGQDLLYVGDPVALIAAETREIADTATELIEVEYEVLPAVLDGMEAAKDGAPQLYPGQFKNNIVTPGYPPFQKDGPFWHLIKGDVDKGFEECAYIAEDTVEFSKMAAPAAPEAPGAIVRWEGGNDFTVWCDTQSGYIAVGSVFMRCWSWCVIGMSLFNMYNSIFQAVGKWKISLLLAVLRLGVIFTVLSLALNALFGVSGLMWVQAITDTLSCLIAMALYQHFKRSLADEFAREDQLAAQTPVTANRIIAISRQFGRGGRTIGKEVAARLGIPCYDSELIDRIAAESGLAKEYVEKNGESAAADSLYGNAVAGRDRDGQSVADKMWLAQKKVIADLAAAEPCVIVGRCADYILRDVADCMTVFVHASDEKRAERILSVYGEREESPVQRLHDKDKKRRAYYELYTGSDWGAAQNYALCLDSGKIGIDGCVNAITELYKHSA